MLNASLRIPPLRGDTLRGAAAIAEFLFGDPTLRRSIYHHIEHHRLPVFRIGRCICARRSSLSEWVHEQERAAIAIEVQNDV